MVLSLLIPLVCKLLSLQIEPSSADPRWTEEDLSEFVHFWLVIICV